MKMYLVLKTTLNSSVYNKAHKRYLFHYGICDRCRWHRGCNNKYRFHKNKSWKQYRKYQYK